jgi:dienelactone hydrolase
LAASRLSALALVVLLATACAAPSFQATNEFWDTTWTTFPKTAVDDPGCQRVTWMRYADDCLARIGTSQRVVLYMHGCAGLTQAERHFLELFRDLGYVVVAPNSFGRERPRADCAYRADKRDIINLRMQEIDYALARIKQWPWIDERRLVLAGFSEGGVTTALYAEDRFAARIILGWHCVAAGSWWTGIRGSSRTPVLSVLGAKDEYLLNAYAQGHCGEFMNGRPGSRSLILPHAGHQVVYEPETRQAIEQFLGQAF